MKNTLHRVGRGWLVVAALQTLLLLTLWSGGPRGTAAVGQIPDAGAQRNDIIEQLKSGNDKLDKILTLLNNGDLQVRLAKSDDGNGHDHPSPRK